MNSTSIQYYNKMQYFFIFKGKKNRIERLFKEMLLFRAKNNKESLKSELNVCWYNSIPYIRLKTKKNRKRVLHKITLLDRTWAEKQPLKVFSNQIRSKTSQNFQVKLETQIEALAKERNHPIRLNIENLHRLGKKDAPSKWFVNFNK